MKKDKLEKLNRIITDLESVVVAFSGGVDSTLLLALCINNLGSKMVIAATADSSTLPRRELTEARVIAEKLGAQHVIIPTA